MKMEEIEKALRDIEKSPNGKISILDSRFFMVASAERKDGEMMPVRLNFNFGISMILNPLNNIRPDTIDIFFSD
jgi:hypothetical protein